jgi:hypothetical protein
MIFEGGSAQLLFSHDASPIWNAKLFGKPFTTLQSVAPSRFAARLRSRTGLGRSVSSLFRRWQIRANPFEPLLCHADAVAQHRMSMDLLAQPRSPVM